MNLDNIKLDYYVYASDKYFDEAKSLMNMHDKCCCLLLDVANTIL